MWVESEPGLGSRFHFTILTRAGEMEPGEEDIPVGEPPSLAGELVAVVGGRKESWGALRNYFDGWGVAAIFIASAQTWKPEFTDAPFSAAIFDFETQNDLTAKQIKQLVNDKPALVLHFMGAKVSGLREQLRGEGMRRQVLFQTKPFKNQQLRKTLNALLSKGEWLDIEEAKGSDAAETLAIRRPFRVLVVEDHPVNQRITLLLLRRLGYQADIVNDGLEAVEALRKQVYDVVFMDMHMPEMDGPTATRAIREFRPLGERPWIIALTANAMRSDREACLNSGMNDYVSKPIVIADLQGALERVDKRFIAVPMRGQRNPIGRTRESFSYKVSRIGRYPSRSLRSSKKIRRLRTR